MNEDHIFEQNCLSRSAKCFHKIGYDSTRLMKWMGFYVHFYGNKSYFDLMASVLTCLNDVFQWQVKCRSKG